MAAAESQAALPANGNVRLIAENEAEAAVEAETDPFATPLTVEQGQPLREGDVVLTDAGTVTIHVNEASLVDVLRMLSLQSQKNIVASKDVRGSVTANLYDVTMREALDAILRSNGFDYREDGNFIYVYSQRELDEIERANRRVETEVFRLYYTPAATAMPMILPVLSSDHKASFSAPAATGISSGGDSGGNSNAAEDILIVTDYPENLEQVRMVLREVDRRPQQILIEATILRAAITEDNALGVDFTVLGGVNFNNLAGPPALTRHSALTGGLVDADTDTGVTGYTAGGTTFNQVGTEGLKVGIVYNNVAAFISALEQVTDTAVVANPKVLTLNKQKGQVIVGKRTGYITTTVTDTAAVQTVEFLDTGTRLIFRPFIGDDGFVRMEIHPEDSSGGLDASNLPFKFTTEVTTNVMVRDGHTIVIGGLFREDSSTIRGQVPFLGNLPIAGSLFRRQRDLTTREEVIILLTPHIIKDDVAYSQASEEELRNLERLRVGVRKGMMFFGRERLAESHYEKALAEMNKPQPNRRRALWYLNGATNLNPKFLEAIELRQSLTGREITGVDNSSIRYFVREQILREHRVPAAADGEMTLLPLPWDMPLDGPVSSDFQLPLAPDTLHELQTEPEAAAEHALADCIDLECAIHGLQDIEMQTEMQTAEAEATALEVVEIDPAAEVETVVADALGAEEPAESVTVIEMLADDDDDLRVEQVIIPLD